MPTHHVEMLEGRTLEQKKQLVEAITRVSAEVPIADTKRGNRAAGGKLWSEPRD